MTPDQLSGPRPNPVVLRIKLRYDTVEVMVQRFAPNVGRSGLFLPTRSVQPVGAEIKFELRLANDQPVLVGLGRVKVVKEPDPGNPKATFGIGVELMRVTRESRELILQMLERRRRLGLVEVGVPLPSDIDAARRSDFVESVVKDGASGAIPAAMAMPALEPHPEGLLTSPRRPTGPIAVAKAHTVEPLAAEPPRKRRVLVSELIERASGPIGAVTVPGLDDDVDVAAALARARLLATGDLDGELDALRDQAAAPLFEITIEAASAELAKQLGGVAVRRDRSQGWAPPPAIATDPGAPRQRLLPSAVPIEPASAPEPPADQPSAPVAPAPDDRAVEELAVAVDSPGEISSTFATSAPLPELGDDEPEVPVLAARGTASLDRRFELPDDDDDDLGIITRAAGEPAPRRGFAAADQIITEPRGGSAGQLIDDDADPADFGGPQPEEHEVDDGQIDDEIHQLSEADFEEVEHTQIGAGPAEPAGFEDHGHATTLSDSAALAARLDAHLADAEADDDLGLELERALGLASSEPACAAEDHLARSARIQAAGGPEDRLVEGFEGDGEDDRHPIDNADDELSAGRALGLGGADERADAEQRATSVGDNAYDGLSGTLAALDDNDRSSADEATRDAAEQPAAAEDADEDAEEIDDFEILAEADAEDADLLVSHGEIDVTGSRQIAVPGRHFPNPLDFAARLDLGDESDLYPRAPEAGYYERSRGYSDQLPRAAEFDPRALSAGHALAAFDDEHGSFDRITSGGIPQPYGTQESYPTEADELPEDDFDSPHASFSPPHAFDQSDVIAVPAELAEPRRTKPAQPSSAIAPAASYPEPALLHRPPATGPADYDLETALEALDVDLDDLSIPHGATERPREPSASHRVPVAQPPGPSRTEAARSPRPVGSSRVVGPAPVTPSGKPNRAATDDGILIDFDDDDE